MTLQPILSQDPYYVDQASDAGRLYLVRTCGSLSGGTRVTLVSSDSQYKLLRVSAKVRVRTNTAPNWKDATEEVLVTLNDLVIRRMSRHPDTTESARKERRKLKLAGKRVLAQLQAKAAQKGDIKA